MPIKLNGKTYYSTAEACRLAGISKSTYLRWVKMGELTDVRHRDSRNWRLFTLEDVARLTAEKSRMHVVSI